MVYSLYDNAPLIEVIAEIRWQLVQLTAIPGGAIDPHFGPTADSVAKALTEKGYGFVEKLVPDQVPREFLAGQPLFRYRKAAGQWPLYQLGPGVFTCNVIPPYYGWDVFKEDILAGLKIIFDSYPSPEKHMVVQQLDLRYIDAYTGRHGLDNYQRFVNENLGIQIALPSGFLERFASDHEKLVSIFEIQCPLREPNGSTAILKATPGKKDGEEAVIAELRVASGSANAPKPDPRATLAWFDAAHTTLHDMFDATTSSTLKERMKPRKES